MDQFDQRWQRRQERWARRQERWARATEGYAHKHSGSHGTFIGGIIIALGVLFLLDNLGIVRFHDVWQYWPVILIVVGAVRIVDSHGPAAVVWGGLVGGAGVILLLDNLGLFRFNWGVFWPVILIGWGLMMLLRPRTLNRPPGGPFPGAGNMGGPGSFAASGGIGGPADPGVAEPSPAAGSPTLGLWTVFGGGRRQVDSQDFQGGEVTAIFGGYELDLRRAAIAQEQALIDVTAVFGGVEIRVPDTWIVESRGIGVFGGFGDETRPPRADQVTRPQRLIVTGVAAFGGVSVKN